MFVLAGLGLYKLVKCRCPDLVPRVHIMLLIMAFIILLVVVGMVSDHIRWLSHIGDLFPFFSSSIYPSLFSIPSFIPTFSPFTCINPFYAFSLNLSPLPSSFFPSFHSLLPSLPSLPSSVSLHAQQYSHSVIFYSIYFAVHVIITLMATVEAYYRWNICIYRLQDFKDLFHMIKSNPCPPKQIVRWFHWSLCLGLSNCLCRARILEY